LTTFSPSLFILSPPSYIFSVDVCSFPSYSPRLFLSTYISFFLVLILLASLLYLIYLVSVKSQGNILIWNRRISRRISAFLYVLWINQKRGQLLQSSLLCPREYLFILY
jgi:hypothetical protein